MRDSDGVLRLWVAEHGDDTNSGLEPDQPKKTLSAINPLVEANTIVEIAQGVYQEQWIPSGSPHPEWPVTYRCPNGKAIVRPPFTSTVHNRPLLVVHPNIVFEGLSLDGINGDMEACKVVWTGEGVGNNVPKNIVFKHCEFHNAWRHGILIVGADKGVSNIRLENFLICESGRDELEAPNLLHGAYVKVPHVTFDTGRIVRSAAFGITVYGPESAHDPRNVTIRDVLFLDWGWRDAWQTSAIAFHNGGGHVCQITSCSFASQYKSRNRPLLIESYGSERMEVIVC